MTHLFAPRKNITEPVHQQFGHFRFYPSHFVNTLRKRIMMILHAEMVKCRLTYFHVISPNGTKYTTKLNKKLLQNKTKVVVWRQSAGLQGQKWITVQLENKVAFVCLRGRVKSRNHFAFFLAQTLKMYPNNLQLGTEHSNNL